MFVNKFVLYLGRAGDKMVRILKRIGLGLLGLIALLIVSIQVSNYRSFARSAEVYGNVSLGQSQQEVQYRLGDPDIVLQVAGKAKNGEFTDPYVVKPTTAEDEGWKMPAGRTIYSFDHWTYGLRTSLSSTDIEFKNGKVSSAACFVDGTNGSCLSLYDVRVGDTEEQLVTRLGQPTKTSLSDEVKTITYSDLGAEFFLKRAQVYGLKVTGKPKSFMALVRRYFQTVV